jgi:hypothetical protein
MIERYHRWHQHRSLHGFTGTSPNLKSCPLVRYSCCADRRETRQRRAARRIRPWIFLHVNKIKFHTKYLGALGDKADPHVIAIFHHPSLPESTVPAISLTRPCNRRAQASKLCEDWRSCGHPMAELVQPCTRIICLRIIPGSESVKPCNKTTERAKGSKELRDKHIRLWGSCTDGQLHRGVRGLTESAVAAVSERWRRPRRFGRFCLCRLESLD